MRATLSYTPAAASLTGFLSNATGATWTLTATNAGDSLAHLVTIRNDSATDHSAKTAILTGTDADGTALTETVNLPAGTATVTSTKHFKTLTTVVPSATIGADTMDIGWSQVSVTPTVCLDSVSPYAALVACNISGTINYSGEEIYERFQNTTTEPAADGNWITMTGLSAKTADANSSTTIGSTGVRVKVNTVTAGATLAVQITQAANQH